MIGHLVVSLVRVLSEFQHVSVFIARFVEACEQAHLGGKSQSLLYTCAGVGFFGAVRLEL